MSFFHFDPGDGTTPQRWVVSDRFWVYWAAAAPITAVTMLLGLAWMRSFPKFIFGPR